MDKPNVICYRCGEMIPVNLYYYPFPKSYNGRLRDDCFFEFCDVNCYVRYLQDEDCPRHYRCNQQCRHFGHNH